MIEDVQKHLRETGIEGWLIYDFHKSNPLAHSFLKLNPEQMLSRRFFYWIPSKGTPVKIVHAIESGALDHLPGEKQIYLKWQTLHALLKEVLKGSKKIAMEYSPRGNVPYISKVDGGMIDLIRECGVEVVSSGSFLQYYTCVWTKEQLDSHLFAADVLDKTAAKVWKDLSEYHQRGKTVTEYDVQQWILKEFDKHGCETDHSPNCSVNAHSAQPHYMPNDKTAAVIKKGDFVLIDLWCKQKKPQAVYADITRVASSHPTAKQKEIFEIVRSAQKAATEYVERRYARGEVIKGFEVDEAARKVIEKAGYGEFFTHRTGHNINTDVHGPGANLDSLETLDDRPLIPGTCFSVEPGIYLPGEFGIRLEYDVFLAPHGKIMVTGGHQDELVTL